MATEVDRLIVTLEARVTQFEKAMQKAVRDANTTSTKIEKSFKGLESSLGRIGKNIAGQLFGPIAGALAIREVVRAADAYTNLTSKLKLVTSTEEERLRLQGQLLKVANETRTGIGDTVTLYQRLSLNTKALGLNQRDLLRLTTSINKSFQIGGASASEAAGGVRQFTQALASGVLRGDEFNSVMENGPDLAQRLAEGLAVPIGALRAMAEAGELTATRVIKALQVTRGGIERDFAKMPRTIAGAMTQLTNNLLIAVGGATDKGGATNALTNALDEMSKIVTTPEFASGLTGIATGIGAIGSSAAKTVAFVGQLNTALRDISNADWKGMAGFLVNNASPAIILENLVNSGLVPPKGGVPVGGTSSSFSPTGTFSSGNLVSPAEMFNAGALPSGDMFGGTSIATGAGVKGDLSQDALRRLVANSRVEFSIKDALNQPESDQIERWKDNLEGVTKAKKDATDQVIKMTSAGRELVAGVEEEAEALGQSEIATKLDVLAKRDDIVVTEAQTKAYEARLWQIYEYAKTLEDIKKAEQEQIARMDAFRSVSRDVFGGFAHDLKDGVGAAEALKNALERLSDRLLDLALDQTLAALLGKPGTNQSGLAGNAIASLLGSLGGSGGPPVGAVGLFHRGGIVGQAGQSRVDSTSAYVHAPRLHSGLASDEFRAILKRGETVIPAGYGGRGGLSGNQEVRLRVQLESDMLDAQIVSVTDPRIRAHVERNSARVPSIITNAKRRGRV